MANKWSELKKTKVIANQMNYVKVNLIPGFILYFIKISFYTNIFHSMINEYPTLFQIFIKPGMIARKFLASETKINLFFESAFPHLTSFK